MADPGHRLPDTSKREPSGGREAPACQSCLQSGVRSLLSVSFKCLLGALQDHFQQSHDSSPGNRLALPFMLSSSFLTTASLRPAHTSPAGCRTFLPLHQLPHPTGTLDLAESVIRGEVPLYLAKGGPRHGDSPQSFFSNMGIIAKSVAP